jgi:PEGA domain
MGGRSPALATALAAIIGSRAAIAQSASPPSPPPPAAGPGTAIAPSVPAAATPIDPPTDLPTDGAAVAEPTSAPDGSAPATPAKDLRAARRWLVTGRQSMLRGAYLAARGRSDEARAQFDNAAAAFTKAIDAGDDLGVYLELAAAEDKLGKLDAAIRHVRRVVDAKTAVRPDIAKRAGSKLDELVGRVGLVTLVVVPAGASITLGGAELGTAPLPEPLVLLPGTYTLSFQADGFQPREAELHVDAGAEIERTVELEAVKVIVQPVRPASESRDEVIPRSSGARGPFVLGAGISGAAAIGFGVFGGLASRHHATFTGRATSSAARDDARTRGERYALASDISLVTAVAAAGFTVYWYIYKYRQPHRTSGTSSISVTSAAARTAADRSKLVAVPWVQPESTGVAITGGF